MILRLLRLSVCCAFILFGGAVYASNTDWMRDYAQSIENKPLKDIMIPGTHDSATYVLEDKFGQKQDIPSELNILKFAGVGFAVTGFAKNWAMAQSRTILQQLEDGNRYIDLRVIFRESKKEFYLVHSLYGPSLSNVLDQIKTFIRLHPKEVVIVQIGDMRHMPEEKGGGHTNLITQLRSTFAGKLVPKSVGTSVTLKELWAQNKQIILMYNNSNQAKKYEDIWDAAEYLESYWANEDTVEKLTPKLTTHLEQRNTTYKNEFYVVQSVLTPNDTTIKTSLNLIDKAPRSLKDLAGKVREKFSTMLAAWKDKNPNIIIIDFADAKSAQEIIQLNKSENAVPKSEKGVPNFMEHFKNILNK